MKNKLWIPYVKFTYGIFTYDIFSYGIKTPRFVLGYKRMD